MTMTMTSWILSMSKVKVIPPGSFGAFLFEGGEGMEGVCKVDLVDRLWLRMVLGCGGISMWSMEDHSA